MAFALLIIGITLIVAAVRNTQGTLVDLLIRDFSGEGNFVYWIVALLLVGSVGYVPRLKPISDGFLVIIILALLLSRGNPKSASGGFFEKFTEALGSTKTPGTTSGSAVNVGVGGVNVSVPSSGTGNIGRTLADIIKNGTVPRGTTPPPSGSMCVDPNPNNWPKRPDGTVVIPAGC